MKLSQMRVAVDAAIADLNANTADSAGKVRVAWGEPNRDEEKKRRRTPPKDRWKSAAITFEGPNSWYIDAEVSHDHWSPASAACLTLYADFDGGDDLPRGDARRLFNLLNALADGVRLSITPNTPDMCLPAPDAKELTGQEIVVWGVETSVPVERLTGAILDDTFARLLTSANALQRILDGDEEEDDDAWIFWTQPTDEPDAS
jgi:hypothetical protein